MKVGQASQTAIGPAILRGAHQVLDAPPRILDDPVAVGLVGGSSEAEILARAGELQQPVAQVLRSLFVLRSRFAEDQLEAAARAGVGQYVVLGAGLDTFAFRQPPSARPLRIIEADHPASQTFKRHCLEQAHLGMPANVAFCPIDFETTQLEEGLSSTDFDSQAPAFFSWLGVTQYIQLAAIEATLRFVLSLPSGSGIAFTFVLPDSLLAGDDLQAATLSAAHATSLGEPWITRFDPAHLTGWLRPLGFADVFHLSPSIAEERYFDGRLDGLRAPVLEQLICVTV